MIKNYLILFLAASLTASAQTSKAITESGKEVVLFDNGTWRFTDESDAKSLETITNNPKPFVKSRDATFRLKSTLINVGIAYNPKEWQVSRRNYQHMEYQFFKDEMYVSMMTEKTDISSLETVKEIMITNVRMAADYFRLKESEYRTVNGKKLLFMRYIANVKGLDFEYAGYYLITKQGFAMLVGYTHQKDFEAKFPQIEEFLNGFVETDPDEVITETVEEIKEYTAPPPPIRYNQK